MGRRDLFFSEVSSIVSNISELFLSLAIHRSQRNMTRLSLRYPGAVVFMLSYHYKEYVCGSKDPHPRPSTHLTVRRIPQSYVPRLYDDVIIY